MLEIYINYESDHLLSWCSQVTTGITTPALLEDDTFYPTKLDGYSLDTSLGLGQYILKFSEDLYNQRQREKVRAEAEVTANELLQKKAMQDLLASATDEEALSMKGMYRDWKIGEHYEENERINYGDKLFKSLQDHISQANAIPGEVGAESLYTEISLSKGDTDEPIPYRGNMILEKDKIYEQDNILYRCTRDTGVPVYHNLADLVGQYVERISE